MVALMVIMTFVTFILVDGLVQWHQARRTRESLTPVDSHPIPKRLSLAGVGVPRGLFLDRFQTWLGVEPEGSIRVGANALATRAIGRIDEVRLPAPGQQVKRGTPLFSVRQGGRLAWFRSPVDGVVDSVNGDVVQDPAALQKDPYRRGWICMLKPERIGEQLREMRIGEDAADWLRNSADRLRTLLLQRSPELALVGPVLQDGGELGEGVLESYDDSTWNTFCEEFLGAPPEAKVN